jgi:glycosyltransferase involved in cell wall biosynthesis
VNEEMALLFPAGNVEVMADQMVKALQHTDWKVRSEKAYAYALDHFEINRIAAQYEAVYDQLLRR